MTARCTRAARIRRVNIVYKLLLRGWDTPRIVRWMLAHRAKWGVKERTIKAYIHDARQLLIEDGQLDRALERGRAMTRLHRLWEKTWDAAAYRDALAVQKEIDEIAGVKAPVEVNINDARRKLAELLAQEAMDDAEDDPVPTAQGE